MRAGVASCKQGNSQEEGGLGTNLPHSLARRVPLAKRGIGISLVGGPGWQLI
jgi:hypothetical protein